MIKILSQSDIALFVRYFHKDLYISETDLRDYFAINMENDSKYDYLLWLYELIDLRIIKKVGELSEKEISKTKSILKETYVD